MSNQDTGNKLHKNEIRQIILAKESQRTNLILWDTTDPRFAEIALALLEDDKPLVVNAAIRALGKLKKLNSKQYLSQVSPFLENPDYCASVIAFMAEYGAEDDLVKRLFGLLHQPDKELRVLALRKLANLSYQAVPNLLDVGLSFVNDADVEMRVAACSVLGRYPSDERAIAALIAKLTDNERYGRYRSVALEVTYWLRDEAAIEPLMALLPTADNELGDAIVHVLCDIAGQDLLDFFHEQAQKHRLELVRLAIVNELRYFGDSSSIAPLIHILQNDPSAMVQKAAAESLRSLGDPQGIVIAEAWIKDDIQQQLRKRYGLAPKN